MMDNTSGIQAAPQGVPRPARLNPFAFPSDTSLRFILLILCVLGASLWIYHSPFLQRTSDFVKSIDAQYQCIKGSNLEKTFPEIASLSPQGYTDLETAQSANQRCMAPFYLQDVIRMLVGVILLLSVAGAIYLTFPAWKRWRKRLVPLPVEDLPDVTAELANLCREARLARQPAFVWNPLNPVSEGLAFGRLGRYSVALTGGLVKQFYTDLPAFRAVIRHELAHLRNADVDKTYFSVAIWWAFIITALIPGAVYLGMDFTTSALNVNLAFYINIIGRVLALAVLVLLTRNAVLRARELYADVRASTWDGPTGALNRVLEDFTRSKRGRHWAVMLAHPDPETRYTIVHDTRSLFQIGFWMAFGTGIAAAITFDGIFFLFSSLGELLQFAPLAGAVAGLFLGGLAVGVVGSALWRATFAALAEGKTPRGTGRIALSVVLGIAIGQLLSLSVVGTDLPSLNTLGEFLAVCAIEGFFLLGSLWLILRWIVTDATTWLHVSASTSTLRWSSLLGLIVAGGIWAGCFGSLLSIGELILSVPVAISVVVLGFAALLGILIILAQPFIMVELISLWAVPLSVRFWRKRGGTPVGSSWAWLDPPPQQGTFPRQEPFHIRLALLTGIAGGLLFCVLELNLRFWLHLTVSEAIRAQASFKLDIWYWSIIRAAVVQAGVAIVTAAWARRLGGLQGLFAAFIAGCVATVGFLGINLLFGGSINPSFAWNILSSFVLPGGLLAVLVAPAVAALTKRLDLALRTGLVGGLFYCGLILCLTMGWRFLTHGSISGYALPLLVEAVLLVLSQLIASAIVAARTRRWSWLQGLFAALITGIVGSASIPLSTLFQNESMYFLVSIFMAAIGLLLALPVALIVSVVATQLRRKDVEPPMAITSPSEGSHMGEATGL